MEGRNTKEGYGQRVVVSGGGGQGQIRNDMEIEDEHHTSQTIPTSIWRSKAACGPKFTEMHSSCELSALTHGYFLCLPDSVL